MAFETIRQALVDPSLADGTVAACLLSGIQVGLLDDEIAKDWAFQVIEARELPAVEIIEVATARHRSDLCEALKDVRGDRDGQLAGRILLRHLFVELSAGRMDVWIAAASSELIARNMDLPEEVYYKFMILHDYLHLAHQGVNGTVAGMTDELLEHLESSSSMDLR
ncbi:hypothetical protein [Pinirhizobacter soli]|uniref:hypothetical protein n=1 Tax=Pinirhizobacter soli TaxID=2786953 RepID=UPI00202A106F|nr:hypothetical protein [Pinirhizobacter soli]